MKVICFYSKDNKRGPISLAAVNKLDYIFKCFVENGEKVTILSLCTSSNDNSKHHEETLSLNDNIEIKYPVALPRNNSFNKIIHKISYKNIVKRFLNKNVSNGELVYIYHVSLLHKELKNIIKRKNLRVILEVEEIYGDVSNNKSLKAKELDFFRYANGYLFPTESLNNLVNIDNKPYVIAHGTYENIRDYGLKNKDGKIHCVYSGTLDPRKGGANAAIDSCLYLHDEYVMHILGFGNNEEINQAKSRIDKTSSKTNCKIIFEGQKTGEDYYRFLQMCDIGLATQSQKGIYNDSSFPSKILTYMCNNLRVVATKIPVLMTSKVNNYLIYSESDNPQSIADAIKSADLSETFDGRNKIKKLDKEFKLEFNGFLNLFK